MPVRPEPPHPAAPTTGVLVCNVGTPDAPYPREVRRYLAEFLSDPRIIELPRVLWWPILHGIVLRVRPRRSAAKYAHIWTAEGSPLLVWTQRQAGALQDRLCRGDRRVLVLPAMRYGQPAIADQLDALVAAGATRVLVVPLHPQYSGTTTASVSDAVMAWASRVRHLPELRFVNGYHDHPGHVAALAASVREHWARHGCGERLVMSFHGLPERMVAAGDPYHDQCTVSARLLAKALELPDEAWVMTFQSRFGSDRWLQPATEPTLVELAASGVGHVDVVCPGFAGDCLETLEEIGIGGRAAFLAAGGAEFRLVECLNDRGDWLDALADLCEQHLAGWPLDERSIASSAEPDRAAGAVPARGLTDRG